MVGGMGSDICAASLLPRVCRRSALLRARSLASAGWDDNISSRQSVVASSAAGSARVERAYSASIACRGIDTAGASTALGKRKILCTHRTAFLRFAHRRAYLARDLHARLARCENNAPLLFVQHLPLASCLYTTALHTKHLDLRTARCTAARFMRLRHLAASAKQRKKEAILRRGITYRLLMAPVLNDNSLARVLRVACALLASWRISEGSVKDGVESGRRAWHESGGTK